MENNIDFFICIIIIIFSFAIVYKQSGHKSENFTIPINEKYKKNKISNQDMTLLNKFFESMNLTYCSHLIFDYKDPEVKNNKKINKKNKKINNKYAKLLCYENKKNILPKLYIEYISDKIGFGLFADQDFKIGDYIGEFCGTITSLPHESSDHYNYSYLDDTDIVVAPRKTGNELQFANHSEKANVDWKHIVGYDNVEHVIFVAIKNIRKGEQILVDYGEDYWNELEKKKIAI